MTKNKTLTVKNKTGTTATDVLDLVEYAVNETKPQIKTARGTGAEMEIKIGRRKFTLWVRRQAQKRKSNDAG